MEEMIGNSKRTQQPADTFGEQKRDINVETRDCHLVDLLVWWSCSSSRVQRCHRIHSKWAKCYVKTTAMTCAHFPIHVYSERVRGLEEDVSEYTKRGHVISISTPTILDTTCRPLLLLLVVLVLVIISPNDTLK